MKKLSFLFSIFFIILLLGACGGGGSDDIAEKRDISVEYIANVGGTITGEAKQVLSVNGESATFSEVCAKASEGFKFVSWSDGKTEPTRRDTLSDSATFVASFAKISSSITATYSSSEGGYITGKTTQISSSPFTTSEVCAVASEGYIFVSWSDGFTKPKRSDTLDVSKSFVATFKKAHTITFKCDYTYGALDGQTEQMVLDGETTYPVTAYPVMGYKFSHWSNGMTEQTITLTAKESAEIEAIFVKDGLSLPIISITTENGEDITSKEYYLNCLVSVENTDEAHLLSDVKASIRGRGNSTWEYDKKPYKLKFSNKVDLFGNGPSKDWTLIANHSDLSLSRNYLAQSVASLFPTINSTTSVQFVDLYLNTEYIGVYLVCEQIEVQETRVNITESDEIDTGYLIEMDGRKDGYGFTLDDKYYVIKSPDAESEAYTQEHTAFISDYLNNCLTALKGGDYEAVKSLIDVESFAEAYIVFELFNCVDVGYSSFYMHKDSGGKLICGPVWDFDRSLGLVGHSTGAKEYDTLWAKEENPWFSLLLGYNDFAVLVAEKLYEYAPIIEEKLDECYDYLYKNRDSFDRNFKRWRILGTFVWPNDDELTALDTWDLQVEYTRKYLKNSLEYLLSVY